MLIPVFVKGHLTFSIDGQNLEFIHHNISVFGVMGLPWAPLNSRDHFGRSVPATVKIPDFKSYEVRGHIMRELTLNAEHMGVKFDLTPEQFNELSAHIQDKGFYPTDYIRKYPRIPSSGRIQTFPLRVLAIHAGTDEAPLPPDAVAGQFPYIFEVGNLSPNGVLLITESQMARELRPGERLDMMLEPRGWFPMPIRVQGLVCRVIDDVNSSNGNLTRYIGVKFAKVDEVNRSAFLDLLRDILERIKDNMASGG